MRQGQGPGPWVLKLQCSGHLMQRASSLEKTQLGKTAGGRGDRMSWLGAIATMDMNLSKLRETVKDRGGWRAAVHGVANSDVTDRRNTNQGPRGSRVEVRGLPPRTPHTCFLPQGRG